MPLARLWVGGGESHPGAEGPGVRRRERRRLELSAPGQWPPSAPWPLHPAGAATLPPGRGVWVQRRPDGGWPCALPAAQRVPGAGVCVGGAWPPPAPGLPRDFHWPGVVLPPRGCRASSRERVVGASCLWVARGVLADSRPAASGTRGLPGPFLGAPGKTARRRTRAAESEPEVSPESARSHWPSRGQGPFDVHTRWEESLPRARPVPCAEELGKTFRTRQQRGLMINSGLGGWPPMSGCMHHQPFGGHFPSC